MLLKQPRTSRLFSLWRQKDTQRGGPATAEATFAPLEAYPGRSNGDNGSRRVIAGLVQRGYVERVEVGDAGRPCIVEGGKCYRLRLAATAMEAIENGPR